MEVLVLSITLVALCGTTPDTSHVRSFLSHTSYQLRKQHRPLYHVTAPLGWLNDPAAFLLFQEKYHLFYQYYPYEGAWNSLHWGHAVSTDLVRWTHYPPAIAPSESYDSHGCLAGSVLIYNGHLAVFYTGEAMYFNKTRHTQNIAISADGILFRKYLYNPVIHSAPRGSIEFKNPKVWRSLDVWYMIVGASRDGLGHLELYTSPDLHRWRHNATIARSYGDLGRLWESPDLFEVDGVSVLVLSARGIHADGFRFRNAHQTGYVIGSFDYRRANFDELEISAATFSELDRGHDFYAAKSAVAADGRRVLVAWLGMRESEFSEAGEGWASAMTLAREVRLGQDGRLLTPPAREAHDLRGETLEDAWYSPGESFLAGARAFELVVNASSTTSDVAVSLEWSGTTRYTVAYNARFGYVSVDRGGEDGERRGDWVHPGPLHWRLFVDRNSVEVFVGEGELVFSSRVYPRRALSVRIGGESQLHIVQYRLRRSVGYDAGLKSYLEKHILNKNEPLR